MKIEFRKISSSTTPFEINSELFVSKGTFKKLSQRLVDIDFHIKSDVSLICDRCGDSYVEYIDDNMHLKVCDGNFEDDDLDVIECYDHFVDFDAIISGEIEAIKSDYHYCKNCKETQGE